MISSIGKMLQAILPQGNPQTEEEAEIQSIYVMCISMFAFISFACCAYLTKFPLLDKFWPTESLPDVMEKNLKGNIRKNIAEARATGKPEYVLETTKEKRYVGAEMETVTTTWLKKDWRKVDGAAISGTHKDLLEKLDAKRTACQCGGGLSLLAAAISLLVAEHYYFSESRYTEAPLIVKSILCATAFVVVSTFFWTKDNEAERNYRVQKARVR